MLNKEKAEAARSRRVGREVGPPILSIALIIGKQRIVEGARLPTSYESGEEKRVEQLPVS